MDENYRFFFLSAPIRHAPFSTTGHSHLIILDPQLGHQDGLDLLREIRSLSAVPVIIAGFGHYEIDGVVGPELDADEYVTKPLGLRELLARIRAVMRGREAGATLAARASGRSRCQFGGWERDRRARRLTDRVELPPH